MKVLCSPNAYKGTLTALEAAKAMARGVKRAGGRPVLLPVADGGDGTAAVLGGRPVQMTATGPYGERLRVEYRRKGREAIVEVAQVGLARTGRREPAIATSVGVAEMIRHAAERGAGRIVVALGGSASIDAGAGLLAGLSELAKRPRMVAACDVSTRFMDAPRRFGPQKGATPADVRDLEKYFRGIVRIPGGRRAARLPGSGAAGGIGWALALLGAELRPGAAFVLDALRFDDALRQCDFVLTGEGKWDATTREGKAPGEVMRRARRAGVPCVALCGSVRERAQGVVAIARSARAGMRDPARLLEEAAFRETHSRLRSGPGSGKVKR
ncbi:MAG: glycerate [Planctomycetota bacterium]|nr:MAG: glycerate [Planctomycetota bacterium]